MNMPWSENGTVTIDGTATVTMKDGPVYDVPVTQMIQRDMIGISVDPNMTKEHFGDTPIYCIAERLVYSYSLKTELLFIDIQTIVNLWYTPPVPMLLTRKYQEHLQSHFLSSLPLLS
jgi:hypothetical protein